MSDVLPRSHIARPKEEIVASPIRRAFLRISIALAFAIGLGPPRIAGALDQASAAHPPGDYVTVNGAKLWVESEGKGPPILLIAGGPGMSHGYFHPFFSAMSATNRVIYFDAFGRGKSDRARDPKEYTFERDVEDIEALRVAMGLGKIIVFGHSYGGMVAQAYALRYPESVSKLVLSCTLFSGEMWQANNDNCNREIQNQYPDVWKDIEALRAAGMPSSAPKHQAAYGRVPIDLFYFYNGANGRRVSFDTNPDVYYTIAGKDADFLIGGDAAKLDFRTELKRLRMPVLVMAGRYDRVALPRYSVQFKRFAPGAQFVMFEHSGHFPFVEESTATFAKLHSFLNR